MEIDRDDAAQEALRVEAMKRAAITRLTSKTPLGSRPDLAAMLVNAIYKVFPPPPAAAKASADGPEKAAGPSRAEGKPDGD